MIVVSGRAFLMRRAIPAAPQTPTVKSVMPTYAGSAAMTCSATCSSLSPKMSLSMIDGS